LIVSVGMVVEALDIHHDENRSPRQPYLRDSITESREAARGITAMESGSE
jgi:hypothetical protein